MSREIISQTLSQGLICAETHPLELRKPLLILNDFDKFGTLGLPDPIGKCEVDLGGTEGGIGFGNEIGTCHTVAHFPGIEYVQNIQVQASPFL